jgi:hypothetical protein
MKVIFIIFAREYNNFESHEIKSNNLTHLFVCSRSLHLKLFGNHERRVVGLEEALLVEARVEGGHSGGHLVEANLDRLLAALFGGNLCHHGARNAVVESQVHALCKKQIDF